ncbi:MAG: virulence RhuM family protein [Bacilli bacterium]|nr:virulence RhuM family protein [Bacilli bacterium]MDY5996529.1 virulence RhuM family protein [Bacilli bacterium]
MKESNILLYETEDGKINVDVILKDETIWLSQKSMSELFDVNVPAINKHLNNIYEEKELDKNSTISKMEIVRKEGNRNVNRELEFYNLDAIIAVGYRVNSKKATKFRIWATKILKDYMIKGFVIDAPKMKNGPKFGKDYYDELLQTIKEIRLSERRQYQKITDIFEATSVDYNKDSEVAYDFFKIVQNKLHYAITGKTAAEIIYERVDNEKLHMGLTNWKNSPDGKIMKYDISIAKNYLEKEELDKLNDLTNLFLDVAESEAKEQRLMTMKDWIEVADDLLKYRKKKVLSDSGKISHRQAMEKAENEYEKFRIKQDKEYISSMDEMYKRYLEENKK